MADERIVKVTGYLVLSKNDQAWGYPVEEIHQDLVDNMIDFRQLDDVTVSEMPGAVMTPKGIRTDVGP